QDAPVLQLGVDPLTRPALASVCGVDVLLGPRQAAVAAGGGIHAPPPLRNPDRRSASLVGRVGDRRDLGGVECVDDAVLAGGAHVVARPATPARSIPTDRSGPR